MYGDEHGKFSSSRLGLQVSSCRFLGHVSHVAVEARQLEHGRPSTPNPRNKEKLQKAQQAPAGPSKFHEAPSRAVRNMANARASEILVLEDGDEKAKGELLTALDNAKPGGKRKKESENEGPLTLDTFKALLEQQRQGSSDPTRRRSRKRRQRPKPVETKSTGQPRRRPPRRVPTRLEWKRQLGGMLTPLLRFKT